MRRQRIHRLVLFAVACCAAPAQVTPAQAVEKPPTVEEPSPPAEVWQIEMLQKHGVEPNAAGAIRLLKGRLPDAELRQRIDALVKQLGSDEYQERETASQALLELGPAAKDALTEAAGSEDLETVIRARQILQRLFNSNQQLVDEALDLAAFYVLQQQPTPAATGPLLATLPRFRERYLRDAASEALWACVDKRDERRLREALASEDAATKAAALVALEIVCGESCTAQLRGYLKAPDQIVRLAAARALLDRLPRESLAALGGLLASDDQATQLQAERLLRLATGVDAAEGESPDAARARLLQWVAKNAATATLEVPLGKARLQTTGDVLSFFDDFSRDVASIDGSYGCFRYETDVAGKALVADGMLKLLGDHAEGDQRLVLSAPRVFGRATFPRSFRIRAAIGGEAENAGGWHAGVSVGNLRVLFHAGYPGGAFRIQRVDTKAELVTNQNMSFTPAAGRLYEMTIDVRPGTRDKVRLEITIVDPADKQNRYTLAYEATRNNLGGLDGIGLKRIGLERSGRTGGAALFGFLSLRELPPAAGE